MGNQERCFYKIANLTVAISVIECQTWFLINAKQKLTNEDVGACGRGTHQAKS